MARDLYDMTDEELEAAFHDAKAEEASPDLEIEHSDDYAEQEEYEDNSEDTNEEVEYDEGLDEDEIDSDSEQPEEDSDHDTSDESEEDDSSDEDSEETEDDTLDGETDEDEADATDEEEDSEEEEQQAQKFLFKANGQEYEFSDKEIMEQFPKIFGQAMDYTKKMQAIKPYRKTIDAIEQAGLKHDDINLMIDVLKGDTDAVSEVLKRTGVDALDLDSENSNYVAKDYGRDETALALKDVIDTISKDQEYTTTQNILANQWDDNSWNEMSQNPEMIKLLHVDVQSGMYDKVAPIMNKIKVYDGGTKSDLEYYKEAARVYFSEQNAQEAKEADTKAKMEAEAKAAEDQRRIERAKQSQAKRVATKKASSKRKAAAPSKGRVSANNVIDYLDDDDEAFEEWYNSLQDKDI